VAEKLKEMTKNHTNPIEPMIKSWIKSSESNKGLYPWNNGAIDLNPVMKKMLAQLAADMFREVMKTLKPMAGRIHTILVAGKVGENGI
jgi:plasmid segregation protein ParM